MARWRLTASHYLNVLGSAKAEWEYSEVSRSTGRPIKKKFAVPTLLDINDPQQWTETMNGPDGRAYDGYINVCQGGSENSRDIEFLGPPTPDMEPLDAEANAISDSERHKWNHPIESLPGNYSEGLIQGFQKQMAELQAGNNINPVSASLGGVTKDEFNSLQARMDELMRQNTMLMEKLLEKPERRV